MKTAGVKIIVSLGLGLCFNLPYLFAMEEITNKWNFFNSQGEKIQGTFRGSRTNETLTYLVAPPGELTTNREKDLFQAPYYGAYNINRLVDSQKIVRITVGSLYTAIATHSQENDIIFSTYKKILGKHGILYNLREDSENPCGALQLWNEENTKPFGFTHFYIGEIAEMDRALAPLIYPGALQHAQHIFNSSRSLPSSALAKTFSQNAGVSLGVSTLLPKDHLMSQHLQDLGMTSCGLLPYMGSNERDLRELLLWVPEKQ